MGLFWYVMYFNLFLFFFFFFSSRRRHTRLTCDWSSECALPICPLPASRDREMEPVDPRRQHQVRLITLPAAPDGSTLDHALRRFRRLGLAHLPTPLEPLKQIGRASCRERVEIAVVGVGGSDKKE